MLSFHLIKDDDYLEQDWVELDVVENNETTTPIGKITIHSCGSSCFTPASLDTSISFEHMRDITRIFLFCG